MRALQRGEIGSDDAALAQHLDACLGCRGCAPVCPSGVAYGRGLAEARARLFHDRGLPPLARAVLGVFRRERVWRPMFALARALRATGIPGVLAGPGRLGFGLGMLAATTPARLTERSANRPEPGASHPERSTSHPERSEGSARAERATVALFRGCVMDTLFRHVHAATRRTLEANGYRVLEVEGQACCGALHEHAGDRAAAQALARRNVAALADAADYIVVNSAGCGALLKDYGHLLGTEAAARAGAKVRDVSELLAAAGPRPGAPLELDVAYDAPCHLQHAQRVQDEPLAVLRAIPGLRLRLLPDSDKCCGSAGIYSVLRPDMARAVLASKIAGLAAASPRPQLVATGNPGCLMQIGAGLRATGLDMGVVHPVELLDASYRTGARAHGRTGA
jgi:glycolate oxidase iron-sulfur subunit